MVTSWKGHDVKYRMRLFAMYIIGGERNNHNEKKHQQLKLTGSSRPRIRTGKPSSDPSHWENV